MSSTMSMKSMMSMVRMMRMKRGLENGVYDVHDAHCPNTYGQCWQGSRCCLSGEHRSHVHLLLTAIDLFDAPAHSPRTETSEQGRSLAGEPATIRHTPYACNLSFVLHVLCIVHRVVTHVV